MHLFRIAESTELNNAWIVGITVCALIATWLIITLSILLIRKSGQFLRLQALRSVTDGYARKARLFAVVMSFVIAIAGAAALAYALWRHDDLQPRVDKVLAQVTDDTLIAVARTAGVMLVFLLRAWSSSYRCGSPGSAIGSAGSTSCATARSRTSSTTAGAGR